MITAWPTLAADTTPRVRGLRTRSFFEVNAAEIQPRVCGDYCARNLSLASGTDTTPRVRGLHPRRLRSGCSSAIQPRVCGDYCQDHPHILYNLDTTPRVRGLRRRLRVQLLCGRYNPACAGTTTQLSRRVGHSTIQPRVCGDYISSEPPPCGVPDTTPRVRGLLAEVRFWAGTERYNPACAGTTGASRRNAG